MKLTTFRGRGHVRLSTVVRQEAVVVSLGNLMTRRRLPERRRRSVVNCWRRGPAHADTCPTDSRPSVSYSSVSRTPFLYLFSPVVGHRLADGPSVGLAG
ncbi:hypothetical protein BaRGS_00009144 [Batillaria attramentaria]|uniref:Uncharacterized protein n=1 Tax=Batillaria attramentaria TaxID=370345 RepID=A0ABD0LJK1_9CAEN